MLVSVELMRSVAAAVFADFDGSDAFGCGCIRGLTPPARLPELNCQVRPVGFEPTTTRLKVSNARIATPDDDSTLRQTDSAGAVPGAVTGESEGGTDPELARILAAWPTLPEPLRRAMLAMIDATAFNGAHR